MTAGSRSVAPAQPTPAPPGGLSWQDWRHRSACHDQDPELFFPIGTSQASMSQSRVAQAVCRRCPVRAECLRWALDSRQEFGVWGGLTEPERRSLLSRNARASR